MSWYRVNPAIKAISVFRHLDSKNPRLTMGDYTSEDGTSVPQPTEDGTKVSQQIIIFSKITFILS